MSNVATAESRTVLGDVYTVVTFTAQNKYKVSGFINDKNLLERVRTSLDGQDDGNLVEVSYRDYTDFGGVKFPTTVVQKQAGSLRMILIVKEVKPNGTVAATTLK